LTSLSRVNEPVQGGLVPQSLVGQASMTVEVLSVPVSELFAG
jgi:hypothetical protein